MLALRAPYCDPNTCAAVAVVLHNCKNKTKRREQEQEDNVSSNTSFKMRIILLLLLLLLLLFAGAGSDRCANGNKKHIPNLIAIDK